MTRTDIHRPSAIDPTVYRFFDSYDARRPMPLWRADGTRNPAAEQERRLHEFAAKGSPHGSASRCAHCGAHLRYVAVMYHEPTKAFVPWGFDCLDTLSALDSAAAAARRRMQIAAEAARKAERNTEAREAFAAAEPELFAFMQDALANPADHANFTVDVSRRWDADPERGLTSGQLRVLRKIQGEHGEKMARKAEREAAEAERQANAVPVPQTEKRITVVGTLTNLDAREDDYGTRYTMKVVTDDGWTCWGTIPNSLLHELAARMDGLDEIGREGTDPIRVRFDCRVKVSRNDVTHGWISRPTKAAVLDDDGHAAEAARPTCPACGAEYDRDRRDAIYHNGERQVCITCEPLDF